MSWHIHVVLNPQIGHGLLVANKAIHRTWSSERIAHTLNILPSILLQWCIVVLIDQGGQTADMCYFWSDKGPNGEQEGSTIYGTKIGVGPSEKRSLEIHSLKAQSCQGK